MKKKSNNCFLGRKQKIFSVTPRKIVRKITYLHPLTIPLNQKLILMYVVPYNRGKISNNIMQKKVNERWIVLPFSLIQSGNKNPLRLTPNLTLSMLTLTRVVKFVLMLSYKHFICYKSK